MKRRDALALSLAAGWTLSAQSQPSPDGAVDETWVDPARQRGMPVRIRWPAAGGEKYKVQRVHHGAAA